VTAQAAVVPAVIGLAVTPLLLYKLLPPEVQQTPEAPAQAAEKLEKMGSMSRNETIMLGTMCFALVLWVRAASDCHISPCTAARSGLQRRQIMGNFFGDLLARRFADALIEVLRWSLAHDEVRRSTFCPRT